MSVHAGHQPTDGPVADEQEDSDDDRGEADPPEEPAVVDKCLGELGLQRTGWWVTAARATRDGAEAQTAATHPTVYLPRYLEHAARGHRCR